MFKPEKIVREVQIDDGAHCGILAQHPVIEATVNNNFKTVVKCNIKSWWLYFPINIVAIWLYRIEPRTQSYRTFKRMVGNEFPTIRNSHRLPIAIMATMLSENA